MPIKCLFEERKSKSDPTKSYYVLYVPDLEKVIFLTSVETKLAKLLFTSK